MRAVRYFTTLKDYGEMKIGDELHRVLAKDIDGRIGDGVNHCAIAIDLWDDRPPDCTRRPHVINAAHQYHVSVWPESGLRLDFDFYNDAVCQITEMSDSGIAVGGLNYGLRLKNVERFNPPTPEAYARDKKTREAKTAEYQRLTQIWINTGRTGKPPEKPSHMKRSDHVAERIKTIKAAKLPYVDPHEELLAQRAARREREKRDRQIAALKRQQRPHK